MQKSRLCSILNKLCRKFEFPQHCDLKKNVPVILCNNGICFTAGLRIRRETGDESKHNRNFCVLLNL